MTRTHRFVKKFQSCLDHCFVHTEPSSLSLFTDHEEMQCLKSSCLSICSFHALCVKDPIVQTHLNLKTHNIW